MPSVRFARDADLLSIIQLYRHLHVNDDPLPSEAKVQEVWNSLQARSELKMLVVDYDQHLVASCILCVIPNLTRGCRPYGLIENVVTHKAFRRQGFGSLVVQRALEIAWEEGCYKVMLLTGRHDEGTHQFYRGCGFASDQKTGYVAKPVDEQEIP